MVSDTASRLRRSLACYSLAERLSDRNRAFGIVEDIMPIHARAKGMLKVAEQAGHPAKMDFSRLRMPLLAISAEDDRFGTAETARKIAAMVPQSELTILPDGGHIWLGHDEEVADRMQAFIGGSRD
jgi:2-hydroxy-6-oxonona-2,4-dienedioate hydrolase